MRKRKKIKETVKDRYGRIAAQGTSCCSTCGCDDDAANQAEAIGYSRKEIKSVPSGAVMGLGCGNPSALVELKAGETVLDLGSGPGFDAFLAAKKVGKSGKVIGIDMTPQMIKRAKENARQRGYENVEFKLGEIENLPVADNSVDVILSNCVINLSPDKERAYREAFRVLKPGGRVLISDIVTKEKLPASVRKSLDAWAGCVAGAMEKHKYLDVIAKAGFKKIKIVSENIFDDPGEGKALQGKIISLQIKAHKEGKNNGKSRS